METTTCMLSVASSALLESLVSANVLVPSLDAKVNLVMSTLSSATGSEMVSVIVAVFTSNTNDVSVGGVMSGLNPLSILRTGIAASASIALAEFPTMSSITVDVIEMNVFSSVVHTSSSLSLTMSPSCKVNATVTPGGVSVGIEVSLLSFTEVPPSSVDCSVIWSTKSFAGLTDSLNVNESLPAPFMSSVNDSSSAAVPSSVNGVGTLSLLTGSGMRVKTSSTWFPLTSCTALGFIVKNVVSRLTRRSGFALMALRSSMSNCNVTTVLVAWLGVPFLSVSELPEPCAPLVLWNVTCFESKLEPTTVSVKDIVSTPVFMSRTNESSFGAVWSLINLVALNCPTPFSIAVSDRPVGNTMSLAPLAPTTMYVSVPSSRLAMLWPLILFKSGTAIVIVTSTSLTSDTEPSVPSVWLWLVVACAACWSVKADMTTLFARTTSSKVSMILPRSMSIVKLINLGSVVS